MANNYILNQEVFNKAVEEYRKELPNTRKGEIFKWQAVKHFQDNWDIDAEDFPTMLDKSLEKTSSLLAANMFFPRKMIWELAQFQTSQVREMFRDLFNENIGFLERCESFEQKANELLVLYKEGKNHYQTLNVLSTYLWLKYPEKYYIYKPTVYKNVAQELFNISVFPKGKNHKFLKFIQCMDLYNVLSKKLSDEKTLIRESNQYLLQNNCSDDSHHTLVIDFAFFMFQEKKKNKQIKADDIDMTDVESDLDKTILEYPLNQILYGPPGTGKTYVTVEKAVAICDPEFYMDLDDENYDEKRNALKERYDELIQSRHISFVTFHQSFSYEDFVEGIRATTNDDGQIEYSVEDGIFKEICQLASVQENTILTEEIHDLQDREVWKMSLGDTLNDSESSVYDECLENNYVLLGYGYALDYSHCNSMKEVEQKVLNEIPNSTKNDFVITAVNRLKNGMKKGDLIVITDGNRKFRAIAEITGDYFLLPNEERNSYRQARPVKWLRVFDTSMPVSAISTVNFSQMSIYRFYHHKLKLDQLLEYVKPKQIIEYTKKNYVLIIDEINRGNIANIFGELITLLEPSKRAGNEDARSVTLPYSKESFFVPNNLHIIGTMNTSDHSLTKLDLALRRRFEFVELLPNYELLNELEVHGVNIGAMLQIMNDRIEILLGRDYLIGHSYFLPLKDTSLDEKGRQEKLGKIFKNKIIPLLQEYFFEDWGRIQWVLNDQNKKPEEEFIHLLGESQKDQLVSLFENLKDINQITDRRYEINSDALKNAESYKKIISSQKIES